MSFLYALCFMASDCVLIIFRGAFPEGIFFLKLGLNLFLLDNSFVTAEWLMILPIWDPCNIVYHLKYFNCLLWIQKFNPCQGSFLSQIIRGILPFDSVSQLVEAHWKSFCGRIFQKKNNFNHSTLIIYKYFSSKLIGVSYYIQHTV